MLAEQKELYNHTKNKFIEELQRISPSCVSPLIATRQVVKKAIYQYVNDYCSAGTKAENIFSKEDFQAVSKKIYNEIMKGEL
jgi:hypothetical protein